MLIRKALPSDAQDLVDLLLTLDRQTRFMLFEEGERQITVEKQTERLKSFEADSEVMFVAVVDSKLVGFVVGIGGNARRNRHALYIVIGLLQSHVGQGIGKRLMQTLEDWSREYSFHRLELTVMTHNERAIKLYEGCGFEREGVKQHSLLVDGHYVDEFYMAKLI